MTYPDFRNHVPKNETAPRAKVLAGPSLTRHVERGLARIPLNPIQVRYRAAPHPVAESKPANRLENIIPATVPNQWADHGFRLLERARPRPRTTWDYRPPAPNEFA